MRRNMQNLDSGNSQTKMEWENCETVVSSEQWTQSSKPQSHLGTARQVIEGRWGKGCSTHSPSSLGTRAEHVSEFGSGRIPFAVVNILRKFLIVEVKKPSINNQNSDFFFESSPTSPEIQNAKATVEQHIQRHSSQIIHRSMTSFNHGTPKSSSPSKSRL